MGYATCGRCGQGYPTSGVHACPDGPAHGTGSASARAGMTPETAFDVPSELAVEAADVLFPDGEGVPGFLADAYKIACRALLSFAPAGPRRNDALRELLRSHADGIAAIHGASHREQ